MKTCAIIIPVYNCAEYLSDCIESVNRQLRWNRWQYELRLGGDGCRETNNLCSGIPHFYSERNVGAYVMRNSLMYVGRADAYSIFDADDVMCDDFLFRS